MQLVGHYLWGIDTSRMFTLLIRLLSFCRTLPMRNWYVLNCIFWGQWSLKIWSDITYEELIPYTCVYSQTCCASDITYEELIRIFCIWWLIHFFSFQSDITYEELIRFGRWLAFALFFSRTLPMRNWYGSNFTFPPSFRYFTVGHYLPYKDSFWEYIRKRHYFYLLSMNVLTCWL